MRYLTVLSVVAAYMLVQIDGVAAQTPTSVTAPCLAIAHLVCGRDKRGNKRTFGNECEARRAGVVSFTDGQCKTTAKGR